MNVRIQCGVSLAFLAMAACSTPTKPTGNASVTAPALVQPAPNRLIRNAEQPVTLSVANALVTQSGGTTYTFEVATDAGFANKVQVRADIPEGSNGQTSVRLDQLAPGADYYWRVRAQAAGTTGVFGATYKFTVGPAIVINAPTAVRPASGAATTSRPVFEVINAPTQGPVGPLAYRFEVSDSPSFSRLIMDVSVPPGVTSTRFQPRSEVAPDSTLYWRATVIDAQNLITSPATPVTSFATSLSIDLRRVTPLQNSAPDIANFRQTGILVLVEQDGNAATGGLMCTRFEDPGWPDSHWTFGTDPNFGVFANQWYFARIGGVWYGGAGEWIYRSAPSVCKAGQGTRTIGPDSGFGEPFRSWVPRVGEMVGYMISSVARGTTIKRTVDERTDTVVQPWRDSSLGSTALPMSQ
jgi:hypothetical protein